MRSHLGGSKWLRFGFHGNNNSKMDPKGVQWASMTDEESSWSVEGGGRSDKYKYEDSTAPIQAERFDGLEVMTTDFESGDLGSTPSRSCFLKASTHVLVSHDLP